MKPNACSIGLFHGTDVLLIQRARAPFQGQWTFPGGRIEPGETPVQCVHRELWEETRLDTEKPVLVQVDTVSEAGKSYILAIFAARSPRVDPVINSEILDWSWVPIDALEQYQTTDHLNLVVSACTQRLALAGTDK